MRSAIYEYIAQIVSEENLLFNEPMSKHTTFRTGGEADCLIRVERPEQLAKLIPYLRMVEQNYFILGNGSNLLVGDKGYRGIILQIGDGMDGIRAEGNRIKAMAGAPLAKVAKAARDHGLSGLEFASGIPGTIGGGVVMNAGAYGGEMRQVVESVTVLDAQGEFMELDNDTMEFGYRTSTIKNRPFVVTEVTLALTPGNKDEISARMDELGARRREKQPLEYASAGSTFKRPEGYFAGKLIMDAGMRGYRIGGAAVSEKHCGFVVNLGSASAADILEVIEEVRDRVKERFGVTLEPEVVFLGEF